MMFSARLTNTSKNCLFSPEDVYATLVYCCQMMLLFGLNMYDNV